jgi:broad specificity phosphatase PhoE
MTASHDWPELYFIRHGETDWNREGRYQGSKDIPLNDTGRAQADRNGALLRDLLARDNRSPAEFDWYVSPLSRARETMGRIRAQFADELPAVSVEQRLIELSFGIFEGQLHEELASGAMAIAGERDASFWYFRPPKGESYDDLGIRITEFCSKLPRRARTAMSHNTFGHLFRVTTWGESHGPAIGCVVDGCPPRIPISEAEIQGYMDKRARASRASPPSARSRTR